MFKFVVNRQLQYALKYIGRHNNFVGHQDRRYWIICCLGSCLTRDSVIDGSQRRWRQFINACLSQTLNCTTSESHAANVSVRIHRRRILWTAVCVRTTTSLVSNPHVHQGLVIYDGSRRSSRYRNHDLDPSRRLDKLARLMDSPEPRWSGSRDHTVPSNAAQCTMRRLRLFANRVRPLSQIHSSTVLVLPTIRGSCPPTSKQSTIYVKFKPVTAACHKLNTIR